MSAHEQQGKHGSRVKWVFAGFVVVVGVLLFTEHRAHVLGVLPYLLLAACLLMHLFMHHGHGGHRAGADAADTVERERK